MYTQEHIAECKFTKIPCPNKQYGCTKLLLQSQWEEHLERECRFAPVQCPWCSKKVRNKEVNLKVKHICTGMLLSGSHPSIHACMHAGVNFITDHLFPQHHVKQECGLVVVSCSNGCGERLARKEVR